VLYAYPMTPFLVESTRFGLMVPFFEKTLNDFLTGGAPDVPIPIPLAVATMIIAGYYTGHLHSGLLGPPLIRVKSLLRNRDVITEEEAFKTAAFLYVHELIWEPFCSSRGCWLRNEYLAEELLGSDFNTVSWATQWSILATPTLEALPPFANPYYLPTALAPPFPPPSFIISPTLIIAPLELGSFSFFPVNHRHPSAPGPGIFNPLSLPLFSFCPSVSLAKSDPLIPSFHWLFSDPASSHIPSAPLQPSPGFVCATPPHQLTFGSPFVSSLCRVLILHFC